jgi:hypothetical protein
MSSYNEQLLSEINEIPLELITLSNELKTHYKNKKMLKERIDTLIENSEINRKSAFPTSYCMYLVDCMYIEFNFVELKLTESEIQKTEHKITEKEQLLSILKIEYSNQNIQFEEKLERPMYLVKISDRDSLAAVKGQPHEEFKSWRIQRFNSHWNRNKRKNIREINKKIYKNQDSTPMKFNKNRKMNSKKIDWEG